MKMTQEESEAINKKWDTIWADEDYEDENGKLKTGIFEMAKADIDWIYNEAYKASIFYLKTESEQVEYDDFFNDNFDVDYIYDKGDEMALDCINSFGVERVLHYLESDVGNGFGGNYEDYHQSIRELKPKMQNH